MNILDREYITVAQAADYAGLSESAIYKAIRQKTLIAINKSSAGKKPNYEISTTYFLEWLKMETERFKKRYELLDNQTKKLKDFLYGT